MSSSVNGFNESTINIATSGSTNRGTKIVPKSSTGGNMDKNSFMKILAAQLSNLDPTQNQDSSAYVSQMAQFASMEQMTNLNTTMSDSANQQMVGKTVITNERYDDGSFVKGDVTAVIKRSGGTYLQMLINGKSEEISATNIIGVVQTTDTDASTSAIANSKTAVNSDFLAASALAADKKNVVVGELGKDSKIIFAKGKVTGAYIDAVSTGSSAKVKIKVDILDAENNTTNKIYNYEDIIKAGDLTPDEMTATIADAETALAKLAEIEKIAAEKAAALKAEADAAAGTTPTSTATGA